MQRLNGEDALFVYGEATGWPLHMGHVAVYDPSTSPEGLDVERVRDLYRQRLAHLPALRHRLVRVPGALDRPVWVEHRRVDVARHIHGVRLPAPGTDEQLAELVGDLYSSPLDLARPLWDIWVVEGLHKGRVALLTRLHHSAVDGVRGLEVQAATFDLAPTDPISRPGGVPGAGVESPSALRLLSGAALRLAGTPVRAVGTAGELARAAGRLVGVARRHELDGLTLPLAAPRTSLNRRVTARRGFAFCSLPLAPVKEAAHREGVTVNDVVLAVTSGGLRRYLEGRGERPGRSLTVGVPVGVTDDAPRPVGGNRWEVMVASLATDVADPVERLQRIARSTRAGKAVSQAIGPKVWLDLLDFPPALIGAAARAYVGLGLASLHPAVVNVVVSNMRGAPFPVYFAGARMTASYPMGPVADGLGLNMTVISYLDSLDVGLTVCPDVVEEPWRLVEALRDEAADLAERYKPARRPRARRAVRRAGAATLASVPTW